LVLCFRLHFTRDPTTSHTAAATVQQLISHVFERVVSEDQISINNEDAAGPDLESLKVASEVAPKGLAPAAADAFLLFQDLVLLINGDRPYWLRGLNEMTRTFGLELIESLLTDFPSVFVNVSPSFTPVILTSC
jgi:hypothetical protein